MFSVFLDKKHKSAISLKYCLWISINIAMLYSFLISSTNTLVFSEMIIRNVEYENP